MSVIGFDVGYYSCYIAVARQGGIETIANEYSDRCTPSYVAFSETQRFIGNAGKNQAISNLKNTSFGYKKLLARQFDDPQVQAELLRLPFNVTKQDDGSVGIQVHYGGEECVFSPLQITVMLLSKLKETAEKGLNIKVVDCVISVPCFFNDAERRCMLNAATVAGLNCLRLMSDTTATALAYGLYKQDLPAPEEKPRNVVFVDMGSSNFQVSACALNKGKLKMLACTYDTVGGRDLDYLLARHFAEEFKTKYKVDAMTNKRAFTRLLGDCEKSKKLMSANSTPISLNIDCFMEDKDVTAKLRRADLEAMAAPLFERVDACMKKLISAINLAPEDIYAVEIVGGSTRVPAIKQLVQSNFGKEASTTLNADEAVARGCALQCAILSPKFMVRDFSITDCQPFAIDLTWTPGSPDEENRMHLYPQFYPIPQSKILTLYKRETFSIEASYSSGQKLLHPNTVIGRFVVDGVKPQLSGDNAKVKVKFRVDLHGVFQMTNAHMVELREEGTEPMETETSEQAEQSPESSKPSEESKPTAEESKLAAEESKPDDGEEAAQDGEMAEETKAADAAAPSESEKPAAKAKKTKTKTIDLTIKDQTTALSSERVNLLRERELQLAANDRLESERLHAKNSVEEYVYEMRDKISNALVEYITETDREEFSATLSSTEDWLYDEGEDEKKQVYIDRLADLKKRGDPVEARARECQSRPGAFDVFAKAVIHVQKFLQKYKDGDELYDHLTEDEISKVEKSLAEKQAWYDRQFAACINLKKTDNCSVLTQQINFERQALEKAVKPTMTKPKPKVEPPKEEPKPAEQPEAGAEANDSNNASAEGGGDEASKPTPDMEVD